MTTVATTHWRSPVAPWNWAILVDNAIREPWRNRDHLRDTGLARTTPTPSKSSCPPRRRSAKVLVVFTAIPSRAAPHSSETRGRVCDRAAVADLPMDRSMRLRIDHFLSGRPTPHLG